MLVPMVRYRAAATYPAILARRLGCETTSIGRRTLWLVDAFRTAGGPRYVRSLRTGLSPSGLQIRSQRVGPSRGFPEPHRLEVRAGYGVDPNGMQSME